MKLNQHHPGATSPKPLLKVALPYQVEEQDELQTHYEVRKEAPVDSATLNTSV
jgi:hypothetical protein